MCYEKPMTANLNGSGMETNRTTAWARELTANRYFQMKIIDQIATASAKKI